MKDTLGVELSSIRIIVHVKDYKQVFLGNITIWILNQGHIPSQIKIVLARYILLSNHIILVFYIHNFISSIRKLHFTKDCKSIGH